jgi:AcrR family transcriptional regulator
MVAVGRQPETRRGRATHAALVTSVRSVIRSGGGLSADDVAADAGVSVATFYVYFATKDEALAAAFDQVLDEINQETAAALDPGRLLDLGLEEVLRDLARRVVRCFNHDAGVFRLAITRLPESDDARRVYRAREEESLGILTEFVRRGISAGAVRDEDPERLARALLISLQGYQNPLLLHAGAGRLLDELVGMLCALLDPTAADRLARKEA